MYAVQFREYGGPEVLEIGEVDEPHAGPGQIRIRVAAASVNAFDWKLRSGMFAGGKPVPGVGRLGLDGAGVVDEVGEGVTDVGAGDDAFGLGPDTQAEYAVLRTWAPKPAAVDWAVAAATAVGAETAARVLGLLNVGSGSTVLIDGGTGGVGSTAVQLAVARGARVIATAGPANQDYLREIGAVPVVYGEGMADRVRSLRQPVDAVFDAAGKTALADLVALAPEPAQVVTIANYEPGDTGVRLTTGGEGDPKAALTEAARLLQENKLVIKVQTFPFDRVAEAHRISESGHVRGKLVLVPDRLAHP